MASSPEPGNFWRIAPALVVGVLLLGALLFPAVTVCGPSPKQSQAKVHVASLVAAIKSYNIEYGHYPTIDGRSAFLDAESNATLLRVLTAHDAERNPRKIVFFEAAPAVRKNLFHEARPGIDQQTGALIDPWGNPYRIMLDLDYDNNITGPHSDEPPITVGVIAWSLGKDGQQSLVLKKGGAWCDDIMSWQ